MPPPIGRRRIEEFRRAFGGEIESLAALYRDAAAEMIQVLGDASATLFARQRAIAHLRQYQTILAELHDEAAAWIEMNIPRAYQIGLEFADEGARNIRKAGINLGRRQREVFSQVHREAAQAIVEELLRTTDFALAQIGRRVNDVFRRVGVEEVARGIAEGKTRIEVSRQIRERLLREGRPYFADALGRQWDLDRYAEMVARTTTREAMTQGTINRLREHGVLLAQVSAHNAADFCIYYENVIVSIGEEPHPVYPPISAIGGGPPFHPNCVHVLTPFVERLATDEEKKAGIISPDLLNRSPAELQRRFRKEFPERARAAGRGAIQRARLTRARAVRPATPAWEVPLRVREMSAEEIAAASRRSMGIISGTGPRDAQRGLEDASSRLAARLSANEDWQRFLERHADLELSRHPGDLSERVVANLLSHWAGTSSRGHVSVAMQEAAAQEFGMKSVARGWPPTIARQAQEVFGDEVSQRGLRAFLREMYDETQQWFRERGIRSVVIFRGMRTEKMAEGLWYTSGIEAQRAGPAMQPLSSFSGHMGTAWSFADSRADEPYRVLLAAEVPVERIISTGRTGLGTLFEYEYVVLGDGGESGVLTWLRGRGTMTKAMEEHISDATTAKPKGRR